MPSEPPAEFSFKFCKAKSNSWMLNSRSKKAASAAVNLESNTTGLLQISGPRKSGIVFSSTITSLPCAGL
jgi:hypothetical protein